MKIKTLKNLPQLTLDSLLQRRRITLKQFCEDFSIKSVEDLQKKCIEINVQIPKFLDIFDLFVTQNAGIAQLVEHRFCKPVVVGSSPITSSKLDTEISTEIQYSVEQEILPIKSFGKNKKSKKES